MEQIPGEVGWDGLWGQTSRGVRVLAGCGGGVLSPKQGTVGGCISIGGWHSRPHCDASLGLSLPFTKESSPPQWEGINKGEGAPWGSSV